MADVDVDVPWRVRMTAGTVLDDGEDHRPATRRRRARAVVRRALPRRVAGVPRRARRHARRRRSGCAAVEAERPEGERHLAVHEGHVTNVMPRDRDGARHWPATTLAHHRVGRDPRRDPASGPTAIEAAGATEILVHPDRRLRTRDAHVRRRPCAASSELDVELLELVGLLLRGGRSTRRIAGRARIVSQYAVGDVVELDVVGAEPRAHRRVHRVGDGGPARRTGTARRTRRSTAATPRGCGRRRPARRPTP